MDVRAKLLPETTIKPIPAQSFQGFVEDQLKNTLINPFEALAKQQVFAVIVFTLLFGAAMTTLGSVGAQFFYQSRSKYGDEQAYWVDHESCALWRIWAFGFTYCINGTRSIS
jgi:Na+/H+-dicarboxylate symporter